ncbi:hypothetical protein [Trinickia soli]|uniref:hypothetical protein n=1 Tax=Trinickia soli TaxID=380675 RepID=UPI003FA3677F
MSEDSMDLPTRGATKLPVARSEALTKQRSGLTERHVDVLVDSGANLLACAGSIAKDLVEIARIRAESEAEVERIEARSRAIREAFRAEVDRLGAMRDIIGSRGDAAAKLIREVLTHIPESDQVSRQRAIEMLTKMIDSVVADKGPSFGPQP